MKPAAFARANQGRMQYGSAGVGSGTHGVQTAKVLSEFERVLLDELPRSSIGKVLKRKLREQHALYSVDQPDR